MSGDAGQTPEVNIPDGLSNTAESSFEWNPRSKKMVEVTTGEKTLSVPRRIARHWKSLSLTTACLVTAGYMLWETTFNKTPNPFLAASAPIATKSSLPTELTPTGVLTQKTPTTSSSQKGVEINAPIKKIDKEINPKNFRDNFEPAKSNDVIYQAALAQNKFPFQLSPLNENNFYIDGMSVTAPDGVLIRAQEPGKVLTQDEYFDLKDAYTDERKPGIISSAVVLVAPGGPSIHKGAQVISIRTISGQESDEGQILVPESSDYKFLEPFGKSVEAGVAVASVKGSEPFSLYTRKKPRAYDDLPPQQRPNSSSTSLDEYAKAPNGKIWYLPANIAK